MVDICMQHLEMITYLLKSILKTLESNDEEYIRFQAEDNGLFADSRFTMWERMSFNALSIEQFNKCVGGDNIFDLAEKIKSYPSEVYQDYRSRLHRFITGVFSKYNNINSQISFEADEVTEEMVRRIMLKNKFEDIVSTVSESSILLMHRVVIGYEEQNFMIALDKLKRTCDPEYHKG